MLLLFDLEKKNNGQAMNHKFNGEKMTFLQKACSKYSSHEEMIFQMNKPDFSNLFLFRSIETKSSRIFFPPWPTAMLTENPEK